MIKTIFRLSIVCLTISGMFSCNSNSLEEKDLSKFGIPLSIQAPENSTLNNLRIQPVEPGQVTPFEVELKNEDNFSLYFVRYPVKEKRSLKTILSDDFTFEKQYAAKHGDSFKITEQTLTGYIYQTKKGIDFYSYVLKDGYLTTITSGRVDKKLKLEEVKNLFLLAQQAK